MCVHTHSLGLENEQGSDDIFFQTTSTVDFTQDYSARLRSRCARVTLFKPSLPCFRDDAACHAWASVSESAECVCLVRPVKIYKCLIPQPPLLPLPPPSQSVLACLYIYLSLISKNGYNSDVLLSNCSWWAKIHLQHVLFVPWCYRKWLLYLFSSSWSSH